MSTPPEAFYSEERWQNWIDRIEAEDLDPEDESSARLLLNLQDDAAIAVAKVLSAYEEGTVEEDEAMAELAEIREIVLAEPGIEDEETAFLIDGVQTSLLCVFAAAEEFVAAGPVEEGEPHAYVQAAADAEAEEEFDAALAYCVQAGTLIIDGQDLDFEVLGEVEYGLVSEWVNGLDSLQSAVRDPEVIEEE